MKGNVEMKDVYDNTPSYYEQDWVTQIGNPYNLLIFIFILYDSPDSLDGDCSRDINNSHL